MPRDMLRYAATIFISAFLLFLVQPLIGKYILPWFGGGSGVWTACLLFFQCALLAGYFYAHIVATRLSARAQTVLHIAALLIALLFLPIIPREALKPLDASQPVWRIVMLLAATIGVPYLLLSTTGPLLQAWFARTHPGRSPYRLYALSNLGSLLALLGYPFLVEPALTRPMQAYLWSGGFVAFAMLCAWCALAQRSAPSVAPDTQPAPSRRLTSKPGASQTAPANGLPSPATLDRVLWVLLPMCATVMLLAATSQVSEEIAPMPFVWVLPLAVYLLTFIIAFEWPRLYDRRAFTALAVAAPWLYLAVLIDTRAGIMTQAALYLLMLFACCMVCHGEVYRLRPPVQRLTAYYLAISFGGALGGVFVSIIAPLIFTFNVEIYLAMFGSIALLMTCLMRDARSPFFRGANRPAWLGIILTLAFAGFLISRGVAAQYNNATIRMRNFYGSLAVRHLNSTARNIVLLKLMHGRINHGAQSLNPELRHLPNMYYMPSSGIGMVMRLHRHEGGRRIGVVGLGAGTMAAWGEPGDTMRFYEINPQIVQLARDPFTYLADSRAKTEVVLGDGRLSLERETPQRYDILVLDAFSGDAVPTHLLTREAFALYMRHVAEDAVIVVNVTNRYLELHPLVRELAAEQGLDAALIMTAAVDTFMVADAHWMILTRNQALLQQPEIALANELPRVAPVRIWTDDYCNVLEVLR